MSEPIGEIDRTKVRLVRVFLGLAGCSYHADLHDGSSVLLTADCAMNLLAPKAYPTRPAHSPEEVDMTERRAVPLSRIATETGDE